MHGDTVPRLLNRNGKLLHVSRLHMSLSHSSIKHVPEMLDVGHIGRQGWPGQHSDAVLVEVSLVFSSYIRTGIKLLKDEVGCRTCIDVLYHHWAQYLLSITLCVEDAVYDHRVKFAIEMDASPNHHTSPTVMVGLYYTGVSKSLTTTVIYFHSTVHFLEGESLFIREDNSTPLSCIPT